MPFNDYIYTHNKNIGINLRFHLVISGVIKKSSVTSLYNRFVIQCIYNDFFLLLKFDFAVTVAFRMANYLICTSLLILKFL